MRAEFGSELLAELQAPVFLILGVLLDQEPLARWVELRVDLNDRSADGENPGDGIEVLDAELGQLAPPQAGLDVGLDEQPRRRVGQGVVDGAKLLRVMILRVGGRPRSPRLLLMNCI